MGDTDDALRLVLVRDLVSGRAGWWQQHLDRLQPPLGMDLHWSRLVDGGIAAVESSLRLFLDPAQAELAARTVWPFLWLFPAIAAAISIARTLRGSTAAFLCALLATLNLVLYAQWAPGRIDHHDVQIALCLVSLAGAVRGGRGGGLMAGLATAFGLAVGVEGLAFEALIGGALALRFLFDPISQRSGARAYAAGLLVTLSLAFLVQTPPGRWGVSVCDTLGLNLVAATAAASLGLLALTTWAANRSLAIRAVGLGVAGVVAAGVYAGLEPACLHGPLGQADPRLGPIWLSNIAEMQSLFRNVPNLTDGFAVSQTLFHALAVLSWLWLGRRAAGRTFGWGLLGGCLAAGIATEAAAARMSFYTSWFATPLIAAAVADFGAAQMRHRIVPMALIIVVVSPTWVTGGFAAVEERHQPPKPESGDKASCSAPANLAPLARLSAGLVLSEVDLGPYVLATTSDSVLAAPYHRMTWGIMSADAALAAPSDVAETAVRRLHVTYIINCAAHAGYARRKAMTSRSLQVRLDRGQPPAWLEPLSRSADVLQIYRVRPKTTETVWTRARRRG